MTPFGDEHSLDRAEKDVEAHAHEHRASLEDPVAQIGHAVDGDRHREEGKDEQEPGRQRRDRIAEGHAGGGVAEQYALKRRSSR